MSAGEFGPDQPMKFAAYYLLACFRIIPQTGIPGMNSPLKSPDSQTGVN